MALPAAADVGKGRLDTVVVHYLIRGAVQGVGFRWFVMREAHRLRLHGWVSNLPSEPISTRFPFINFAWLHSDFTVLPVQMFTWTADPDPAFQANAAAAGLVLIAFTLAMNAVAITLRYRIRQRIKW